MYEIHFYKDRNGNGFVLLHVFVKQTQKTPPREIKRAKKNLADYQERRKNNEYSQAIEQAQENLADLNERGAEAIGNDALEFIDSILTQEELIESDLRVSIIREMIKARQEKGISQKKTGRIKRRKAAYNCKNGKRQHQSTVKYDPKSISSVGKNTCSCSVRNSKQIMSDRKLP